MKHLLLPLYCILDCKKNDFLIEEEGKAYLFVITSFEPANPVSRWVLFVGGV